MGKSPLIWFVLILLAVFALTLMAPLEKTLGAQARIVYLHGVWVWVAMLYFLAASMLGLLGLITQRSSLHHWSLALGRTGLLFWLTFLLMSLYVMQANWNGLFLDEPRFRIPLNFAIVGLLLQAGLSFFTASNWTSLANLVFGIVLFIGVGNTQAVLHPDSPIFNSSSRDIQVFFAAMILLLALAAWQMARAWLACETKRRGNSKSNGS
jgi:hypothetical protein